MDIEINKELVEENAKFITTSGKYSGVFTSATPVQSRTSAAEGIKFNFLDDKGLACNFLSIWTKNKHGEENTYGASSLSRLLVILGVEKCSSTMGQVKDWRGQTITTEIFPDLINKPIGLILSKTLITKQDGNDGFNMSINLMFQPSSNKTAQEIISNSEAYVVPNFDVSKLIDKDMRSKKIDNYEPSNQAPFHDDIPF